MYRKSREEDCRAIYRLICELEGENLPFREFSEIYREQVNDRHYYCLVCEYENTIIAVLNLRFEGQLHHSERIAEILEFVVSAACRGRGTGKEMLMKGCQIARESGCAQIEVACNQLRTDTHRFYLKEGMENSHFRFAKRLSDYWP